MNLKNSRFYLAYIPFSILVSSETAWARSDDSLCDKLKPEQTLSTTQQKEVDSALRLAMTGFGNGNTAVSTDTSTHQEMQLLEGDALARAWFMYQICVQKEAGVIDAATAQELTRKLMGLSPTSPTPSTPNPAPTTNTPATPPPANPPSSAKATTPTTSTQAPPPADTTEAPHKHIKWWVWVLIGVVVIGAGAGIVAASSGGPPSTTYGDDTATSTSTSTSPY